MGQRIKEIDAYISRSAEFAQPILQQLRELVHENCEEVEEKIKWGFPHFDYKGEMMCSMAAFKSHCSFGFWKAALMKDPSLMEQARAETAMGHLGKISSLKDLPPKKKMASWIKEAMKLNDQGIRLPQKAKSAAGKDIAVPDYFLAELKKNKNALKHFNDFPYSHKKEYIQWITEAKTEATRIRRINTAIEWIAEKKGRNWKYEKK